MARKKRLEHPWSGEYVKHTESGTYCCVCCGEKLFKSEDKFESNSGWAAFHSPINSNAISLSSHLNHGIKKTEAVCTYVLSNYFIIKK